MGDFNFATRPNVAIEGIDKLDDQQYNKAYKYICQISSKEKDVKKGQGLSWNTKAIWILLLNCAKNYHFDQANSGKSMGLSADQTRLAVNRLVDFGIVKVEKIYCGEKTLRNYRVRAYREQDSYLMEKNGTNPSNIKNNISGTNPSNIKNNNLAKKNNYIYGETKVVVNGRNKEHIFCALTDEKIYNLMGDAWGERYRHLIKGDEKQRQFWAIAERYYAENEIPLTEAKIVYLINELRNNSFVYEKSCFKYA